eukprot:11214781-Lingulodinium_polyedra.AAC.1
MKDQYNERVARVTGLSTKHIKVTLLDGPAKGEQRKSTYKQVRAIVTTEPAAKRILASFAGASSAAAAPEAP